MVTWWFTAIIIPFSVPGNPIPSSGLHRHQSHTHSAHIYSGKIITHKSKKKKVKTYLEFKYFKNKSARKVFPIIKIHSRNVFI